MSDAFLNKMSAKEYNNYHRDLFGDEWEDVEYEGKLVESFWDKVKKFFVNSGEGEQ